MARVKKDITLKSSAYMRNRMLSKAWIALKMGASTHALQRERKQMVMLYIVKHTMVAAWNAWCAHLEHQATKRERMRHAANLFLNRSLIMAWTLWARFVTYRNYKAENKGRAITVYKKKLLASTWKGWREHLNMALSELALLKKSMAFIRHQASVITPLHIN